MADLEQAVTLEQKKALLLRKYRKKKILYKAMT